MDADTTTHNSHDTTRSFGYCAWHKGHTEGVRLIQAHEQGSGPGYSLFACAPCRDIHRLTPYADQP